LSAFECVDVFVEPVDERGHTVGAGLSEPRERIDDVRGKNRVARSKNEPIPFELAERLREHLLRNAADPRSKLRIPLLAAL
jgi:hypothetical protein